MTSSYQESNSGTLQAYNDYVTSLLGQGQTLAGQQANLPVPQQQVAGFSGLQNQAFGMLPGMLGSWQPTIQGGLSALSQAQQSAQFDPNKFQQFLNPYVGGVVDEIARLGNKNLTENVLPGVRNNFGSLGQYGSARQMLATGQAAADVQRNITGQQSEALMNSYNNAMNNYGNFAQLGANTGVSAANQYGQLAGNQSQLGIADYGTLFSAGQAQQGLTQQQLNANTANQQANQQQPWNTLNNWKSLFGVTTPQSSSSWSTQLKRGGLVGLAAGGTPDDWELLNAEYRQLQPSRERNRAKLLAKEGLQFPEDDALMRELANLGIDLGDLDPEVIAELLGSSLPARNELPLLADASGVGSVPREGGLDRNQILKSILDQRGDFNKRVQESLRPLPERSEINRLTRALASSNAMGPANFGQIVGRTGKSYFDEGDELERANRLLEHQRLTLEERSLPKVPSLGAGLTGGVEHYKTVRGNDGTLWAVSDVDPNRRHKIQEGGYSKEVLKAATSAADDDLKNATFPDASRKAEARQKLIDYYQKVFAERMGDRQDKPVTSEVPPKPTPAVPNVVTSGAAPVGAAHPPSGTIPTEQETKESEKVGTGMGTEFAALQAEAREAYSSLNRYDKLGQLLQDVQTGKLTPTGTELSAWLKSVETIPWLGGKVKDFLPNFETLPNKEAAKGLIGQMALGLRNPAGGAGMPGALSDRDREFLISMVPSLANSPEGVKTMVEIQRKLARRSVDVAKLARQYRKENPRQTFDEGFYDYLEEWSAKNPLFTQEKPASEVKRRKFNLEKGVLE